MAITMTDRILLPAVISLVLAKTLLAAIDAPFRSNEAAPTYKEYVLTTAVRTLITTSTNGQLQIVLPTFVSAYEGFCKKHKMKPEIVDIPDTEVKGFWIGSKDTAQYTLVYYHGGGFVMPGSADHLEMLLKFINWSGGKLAVFCVAYTLAPDAICPQQLGESVEGLRYILSLPGHSPKNTLLGGDSAGGNLVLAVLSHISGHAHPNTALVKPLEVSDNFFGAITIAPWVSSDTPRFESMRKFPERDIVNSTCAHYWIDSYKGAGKGIKDDEYITPEIAPASWWSGTKVDKMIAVCGEEEVLRDAIVAWADKYKVGTGENRIQLFKGKREIHDAPLVPKTNAELDQLGEACQEGAIRSWIRAQLV